MINQTLACAYLVAQAVTIDAVIAEREAVIERCGVYGVVWSGWAGVFCVASEVVTAVA
jgi:hypothetical protein